MLFRSDKLESMMAALLEEQHRHEEEHHHGHHHDGEECHHGHHHNDEECCHGHHHDGEECHHGHHHDHGEDCTCGCHDHDHHHHHADEVFTSWGKETPAVYTAEKIAAILKELDGGEYGMILRAKGMVPAADGTWIYFDYVPEESDIRTGKPQVTGKLCVIGSKISEEKLEALFG